MMFSQTLVIACFHMFFLWFDRACWFNSCILGESLELGVHRQGGSSWWVHQYNPSTNMTTQPWNRCLQDCSHNSWFSGSNVANRNKDQETLRRIAINGCNHPQMVGLYRFVIAMGWPMVLNLAWSRPVRANWALPTARGTWLACKNSHSAARPAAWTAATLQAIVSSLTIAIKNHHLL